MSSPLSILIVDDEPGIRRSLARTLKIGGYDSKAAADGEEALELLRREDPPGLVLLDLKLPGLDGLQVLQRITESWPDLPVVMMSAHGTVGDAVAATQAGALDFMAKPLAADRVLVTVRNSLRLHRLDHEVRFHRRREAARHRMIGSSPAMEELRRRIEQVAPSGSTVLIHGENGSGKELVARGIHALGAVRQGPFVQLNCSAVPAELIESELFGHERGAFTGATQTRQGRFEQAAGGTLLLDEIGDMPMVMQTKMLRVLQERTFERVGGNRTLHTDARILAATNKDIQAQVTAGRFREDLYYRIAVIPIRVPPLRERLEDLPELVEHLMDLLGQELGKEPGRLSPAAMSRLNAHSWPGNVRELRNLLERLLILQPGPEFGPEEVAASLGMSPASRAGSTTGSLRNVVEECERRTILERLRQHGGSMTRTAESLGLERSHLYKKLKRLGIERT